MSLNVLQLGLCFSGGVEMGHDHASDLTFRYVGLLPFGSVYSSIWHTTIFAMKKAFTLFFLNGTGDISLSFLNMFKGLFFDKT